MTHRVNLFFSPRGPLKPSWGLSLLLLLPDVSLHSLVCINEDLKDAAGERALRAVTGWCVGLHSTVSLLSAPTAWGVTRVQ